MEIEYVINMSWLKGIRLLYHLLHHLPVNLRRFIKIRVSSGQLRKIRKTPESQKYQGLKAYEGI